jgi:hypothetical protein
MAQGFPLDHFVGHSRVKWSLYGAAARRNPTRQRLLCLHPWGAYVCPFNALGQARGTKASLDRGFLLPERLLPTRDKGQGTRDKAPKARKMGLKITYCG